MAMVRLIEETPSPEVAELYRKAWGTISNEAKERLLAIGVVDPSDLFAARDCGLSGGILFKGKRLDAETHEAYLEFQEARIEEVRHFAGLSSLYKKNVLQFLPRKK